MNCRTDSNTGIMGKPAKKKINKGKCLLWTCVIIAVAAATGCLWGWNAAHREFESPRPVTLIIPQGATDAAVGDSLKTVLGDFGVTVYRLWAFRGGNPEKAHGVYRISQGDKAWSVAGRIKDGRSSTVRVTFNNIRTMADLADRISASFPWSAADFLEASESVAKSLGYSAAQQPALYIPDTYEFYASATPAEVVEKLASYNTRFWSQERMEKARELGLTPQDAVTLASIVEEESNNTTERPVIARLYLNRLDRKMRLQADPTVKFAFGDFSIRRLNETHLSVESPYNTYKVNGLPPGPIRIPERATVDAVLNAPANDYLYMCAKPDNSGTHNFAHDYETHLRNARAYRAWLDSRGIH